MLDFDQLVDDYYQPLYRFALSLAKNEPEACDLVQQTFALWARKGHQLRDESKVKTWLFTTLRREFLGMVRRSARTSDAPLEEACEEVAGEAGQADAVDAATVMEIVSSLPLEYREPLMLFYSRGLSYAEIAEILEIPIGTVMSRLSRGKNQLRKRISEH
ncbi:MAG: sigma-70 family RNA polymerase sigma factor [Chthoniobacterales bacterium]